jgi:hypothetical protein
MRVAPTVLAMALALPAAAVAQTPGPPRLVAPPASATADLACAPFLTYAPPKSELRVTGSQDTYVKQMMGPGETLVISGGLAKGIQVGQEYFVRRVTKTFGARGPDPNHPLAVHTAGRVKIISTEPNLSLATITHSCEGVLLNDFLDPFVPPLLAETPIDGAAQFEHLGHIMLGDEGRRIVGNGEFITIDRGSDHGLVAGQRLSVFRDKRSSAGPLVEIGTVVTVSVRPDNATVQVLDLRDAIMRDDLVAVRR